MSVYMKFDSTFEHQFPFLFSTDTTDLHKTRSCHTHIQDFLVDPLCLLTAENEALDNPLMRCNHRTLLTFFSRLLRCVREVRSQLERQSKYEGEKPHKQRAAFEKKPKGEQTCHTL